MCRGAETVGKDGWGTVAAELQLDLALFQSQVLIFFLCFGGACTCVCERAALTFCHKPSAPRWHASARPAASLVLLNGWVMAVIACCPAAPVRLPGPAGGGGQVGHGGVPGGGVEETYVTSGPGESTCGLVMAKIPECT